MSLGFAFLAPILDSGLPARIARVVSSLGRALTHRREVHRLLDLDERGLKDIGLVRGDVVGALEQSWDHDPSRILAIRTAERRARSRLLTRSVQARADGYRFDRGRPVPSDA